MKQTLQSKMLAYADTHALDKLAIRIMRERGCGIDEAYRMALRVRTAAEREGQGANPIR